MRFVKAWLPTKLPCPTSTCPTTNVNGLFVFRQEYACTAVDVLARRTRIAFLDAQVTKHVAENPPSHPVHNYQPSVTNHETQLNLR